MNRPDEQVGPVETERNVIGGSSGGGMSSPRSISCPKRVPGMNVRPRLTGGLVYKSVL